MFGLVLELGQ